MSDQTINQLRASLKDLNTRIKKLGKTMDRLDVLAHQQLRLAKLYRDLSLQCAQLAENMDHLDLVAFEVRQEFAYMQSVCKRVD